MGIPAFFKWLTTKYKHVATQAIKPRSPQVVCRRCDAHWTADDSGQCAVQNVGDTTVPVDWSSPNPNGFEVDNLYLDMNGIIHPCTHPIDKCDMRVACHRLISDAQLLLADLLQKPRTR
jgi:5'-3' exoribonuclease 2